MKRTVAPAPALLLVLLIGGAVGFALGFLTSSERLDRTDATDRNALRDYVSLLDNLSARDTSEFARQIYAGDKALALIRLADLADKHGESAESTRLTSDALAVCSTAGLPYCSSTELRQRAQPLDVLFERARQAK